MQIIQKSIVSFLLAALVYSGLCGGVHYNICIKKSTVSVYDCTEKICCPDECCEEETEHAKNQVCDENHSDLDNHVDIKGHTPLTNHEYENEKCCVDEEVKISIPSYIVKKIITLKSPFSFYIVAWIIPINSVVQIIDQSQLQFHIIPPIPLLQGAYQHIISFLN